MNLPTKITVARILLIPIFLLLYCLAPVFTYYYALMTAVYVLASCTDFVDGHLARKHNMVTDLGKFLDPIADKILVVAGLVVLIEMGALPKYIGAIAVVIILAREFIIGVFRQIAASKGAVLAADKLGKAKTIITLIAIPMLMLTPMAGESIKIVKYIGLTFRYLGWALFGLALILTVLSGVNYIIKNKQVLASDNENEDKETGADE